MVDAIVPPYLCVYPHADPRIHKRTTDIHGTHSRVCMWAGFAARAGTAVYLSGRISVGPACARGNVGGGPRTRCRQAGPLNVSVARRHQDAPVQLGAMQSLLASRSPLAGGEQRQLTWSCFGAAKTLQVARTQHFNNMSAARSSVSCPRCLCLRKRESVWCARGRGCCNRPCLTSTWSASPRRQPAHALVCASHGMTFASAAPVSAGSRRRQRPALISASRVRLQTSSQRKRFALRACRQCASGR